MGLLDDAKSGVSKWFEEQVAKNKAFKAAGGMVKSNPAMTRSMGLLPATGLLEQEGDAAARADAAYGALRKEYGPLGLRPGDFVPFASGGLAIDDARLAAAKGNYGQAAGSLAGVIPVAGAVGKVVRKITGGKSSGVIDSVKREIFAGPNAKTANKAAMKRAEARLAAGDDPATVWAQEGWGRGPDGKMRWEIDDSGSAFSSDAIQQLRDNAGRRQGRFFSNGPLHEAYPETADIFTAKSAGDGASYTSGVVGKSDMISLGLPKLGKVDLDELRRKNTHELQHVIQDQEDFSRGGSPEGMRNEALAMLRRDVASGDIGSTEQAMNMLPMAQRNAYNRLAGEAESRLTEARIDMSPAERAAQYPWAEDYFKQATGVSKGDLIHRGGLLSDGPALSVGKPSRDGLFAKVGSRAYRENLRAWMGDSKVVDENGSPLVVYRGTRADVNAFDTANRVDKYGRETTGSYFTANKEYANEYAGHEGSALFPSYLSIKNPLVIDDPSGSRYGEMTTITPQRRLELESQGYDGIIYHDSIAGRYSEIVAFNNAQIKSAIGNSGRFDIGSGGLGLTGQSGLLNPEITKATNRGLYRTMLDDEEDKPSLPYGLIGK